MNDLKNEVIIGYCNEGIYSTNLSIKADTSYGMIDTNISNIKTSITSLNTEKSTEYPKELQNTLSIKNNKVYAIFAKDGKRTKEKFLIPEIKSVHAYNDAAVVVEFKDGTIERCSVRKGDSFSLEQGISICIMKKVLEGSGIYNKLTNYGVKCYIKTCKDELEALRKKKELEEKRRKAQEKKAKRQDKNRKLLNEILNRLK